MNNISLTKRLCPVCKRFLFRSSDNSFEEIICHKCGSLVEINGLTARVIRIGKRKCKVEHFNN